tara:strand:+ start:9259 stop:10482 length:1224 start_codon:yes stop_codon:yes gene_type:complete
VHLNVLLVSIACPPKKDSESLQVAKYLKYLTKNDRVKLDVITSRNPTLYMPYDSSLEPYLNGVRQVVEVPIQEWRYINIFLRKFFPSIMMKPDSKKSFCCGEERASRQLSQHPDVIYSRSFPLSSTLMAYRLHQKFKCPWVLHLSDPWTINPLNSLAPAQAWNEEMEQRCFSAATVLSFTSDKTLRRYAEIYPDFSHKMMVFPNVFDSDNIHSNPWKKKETMKLVYTGGLVGDRTPNILVDALMLLHEMNREAFSNIEVVLAGETDLLVRKTLNKKPFGINHVGVLNFDETVALQAEADVLLLIDTPTKNSDDAMFFPSKLLDYMLAGRRVFAVTDSKSSTAEVIRRGSLGDIIDHGDPHTLMNYLVDAVDNWKLSRLEYFSTGNADQNYSAKHQAERLSSLFESLT